MPIWEISSCNMWGNDGKWNKTEIDELLNQGYEPFSATSNVYGNGGGSFLGGVMEVKSQTVILFKRIKESHAEIL